MLEIASEVRCFDGKQLTLKHWSHSNSCVMEFCVYLPPAALQGTKVPVLFFLSGLTCTWENVMTKAGIQQYAAAHNIAIVAPDTSPRSHLTLEDSSLIQNNPSPTPVIDDDAYDLGQGAGFYLNATKAPWSAHYKMYDYVAFELPALLRVSDWPLDMDKVGICGHSMGGHGALSIGIKHPDNYMSISAFSPIVAPGLVPWGRKAFSHYLNDETEWADYDACKLLERQGYSKKILIDIGTDDPFYDRELKPQLFEHAAKHVGCNVELRRQDGYDHSYYFIASFIQDHIAFHSLQLNQR